MILSQRQLTASSTQRGSESYGFGNSSWQSSGFDIFSSGQSYTDLESLSRFCDGDFVSWKSMSQDLLLESH